jgi:hypothetical protein
VFGDAEALHTRTILDRLSDGERRGLEPDAPWGDLHGKPLSERGLATMLRKYEVHSVKVKVGGVALQGYRREHLNDAWQRYLPLSPKEAEHMELTEPKLAGVPEVPAAMGRVGSVRCRDCKFFDGEGGTSTCLKFDRPVEPGLPRECAAFGVPL